jgi:Tat protein translocase TatB subunit
MFGISLAEFLVILIVAICVIGPKDMPEVARYIIKMIYKIKQFIAEAKKELKIMGDELGLEEIKAELEQEIIAKKAQFEQEITTIIDIYGQEHQVYEIDKLRPDTSKDELMAEIAKYNIINSQKDLPQEQPLLVVDLEDQKEN